MTKYQSAVTGPWAERRRLMRFRRKTEHLRFSEEIKLVPKGLVLGMLLLLVLSQIAFITAARHDFPEPWPIVQEYGEKTGVVLGSAIGVGFWIILFCVVCLTGYVYRDAKRRGMNAVRWVFLVIVMLPAYLAMGFVFYFTARDPLPYHCPKCGSMVNARYNFCPGCKYALHPTCVHCQREVGELDKYCPYCGNDVAPVTVPV
jgi:RNA polymerase subunit RPABC4/transcription elongation factor Spt4